MTTDDGGIEVRWPPYLDQLKEALRAESCEVADDRRDDLICSYCGVPRLILANAAIVLLGECEVC